MKLYSLYQDLGSSTVILIALAVILFSGFLVTRITKLLHLPNVSGYILAGILIGPYVLGAIPPNVTEGMGFISDIALAFIAFGVGKFFKKKVIRRTGSRIVIITAMESLLAGVLVTVGMLLIFHLDLKFCLLLGAIATATAPASTMMTINQYRAKGEFVNTLLQVVALDDVVCLLAFSAVTAVAGSGSSSASAWDVILPILYNLGVIVLGFLCGFLLGRLLTPQRSKDNRLILAIAMLLGLCGICAAVNVSPLLSCMVFGAAYINLTRDKKLFRQLNNFTPPVLSIFFIVSGMNLDVAALGTIGAVGFAYFLIRIVGKYAGAFLGCAITKSPAKTRNYLGLALIPQAGVAIGLAFLGQRMLPPELGDAFLTIILCSSVLYELIGPASAKTALVLAGVIPKNVPPTAGEADGAAGEPELTDATISPESDLSASERPACCDHGSKAPHDDVLSEPDDVKTTTGV